MRELFQLYPMMHSHIVYVWKRSSQALYVGMSKVGLSRPLGRHDVINKKEPVKPEDILEVWYFGSIREATKFEKRQIKELQPKYNKIFDGTRQRIKFTTRYPVSYRRHYWPKPYRR